MMDKVWMITGAGRGLGRAFTAEAVKNGDFTDEELHVGRQSLVSSLRTMQDSHGRIEDFWVTQKVAGTTGTPEELLQIIQEEYGRMQSTSLA